MARTLKQSGKHERELARQADCIGPSNLRAYDHRGRRLCFNVKDYHGFPAATTAAVAKRFGIDTTAANRALERVYDWAREDFWESADECARFIFNGDESGFRAGLKGEPRAICGGYGRSGGWMSVDHPIFTDDERLSDDRESWRMNAAERAKVRKWLRNCGAQWDWLTGAEFALDMIENNIGCFDFPDPEVVGQEAADDLLREQVAPACD